MSDAQDPKSSPNAPAPSAKAARALRRKAELKANMARRKAQARLRAAGVTAGGAAGVTAGPGDAGSGLADSEE